MLIVIYFLVSALESFLLAIYLLMIGSTPERSVLFNLSFSRLAVVVVVLITGVSLLILAIWSIKKGGKFNLLIERFLQNEKALWITFAGSIFFISLMMFLLTRQVDAFRGLEMVYQRLEPVLVWITIVAVQTGFLVAVWYCLFFVNHDNHKDLMNSQKEIGIVFGVFLVFTTLELIFITSFSYGPIVIGDEITYFDMAESLYKGSFSITQSHHYPPLYPLSIVVAMVFKEKTFEAIKLINVLLSSSIVFPIYLFTRHFLDQKKSLAVTLLTCTVPYHLIFPGRILSENLFFPLFLWVMYLTFSKPKNSNYHIFWDAVNAAVIAMLYLTRYISLALIPSFLLAWWIKPFDGEKSLLRPGIKKITYFCIFIITIIAVFTPWILMAKNEDLPIKLALGFGIASKTTQGQLTLANLLIWSIFYIGYYFLIAAPVLNLIFSSLRIHKDMRWREGFTRLVLQVLIVMGGFFAAVVRHSWRAYYNRDFPSKIMERYLIVFSVIFIMIGAIELANFNKAKYKNLSGFLIKNQIIPYLIVVFSHLLIIKGAFIPTDGNLINPQGSANGFMIKTLGSFFYVLIFTIYTLINIFLWIKKEKLAHIVFVSGLLIYFISMMPSYFSTLLDFQTYPWLAEQVYELVPFTDISSGNFNGISVFLPTDSTSKNKSEFYNGLRVRGIENTIIEVNSPEKIAGMQTWEGFIIEKIDKAELELDDNLRIYEFNNEHFSIQKITQRP